MPEPDELSLFALRLAATGAPYMITGATAAILYGQPRVTNDLRPRARRRHPSRASPRFSRGRILHPA